MKNNRLRLSLRLALAVAVLATLIVAASRAYADFLPADWSYVKPIILPADLTDESLVEIFPDAEVFANSSPGLVDLRIVAADGTEVPYKFEVSKGERQRNSFPVALRDKGYVPGKYTTFIADLGREGVLHNEIEFQSPSSNFRRTAIVEASDDGATWARVAEQEVYDFTVKEVPLSTRNTHVTYTDSTARYLRVRIADDGEGPLEIAGATVFFVRETQPREVSWLASILGTVRDVESRTTVVDVDLWV